jgi:hypothetical protein
VNYTGEAFLGDVVGMMSGESQEGVYFIEGINRTKGSKIIQARIGWE